MSKATMNCVQMYIDRGIDEIEMKILEQKYMTNTYEVIDSVGGDVIRAAHILDETPAKFKSSNMMDVLKREGNTVFVFSDFGKNAYEEVAAFKVRGQGYNRLIIKNRKDEEILVRDNEDKGLINIISANAPLVRDAIDTYKDRGYKMLDQNQDIIINMQHRNNIHVLLGKSILDLVVNDDV